MLPERTEKTKDGLPVYLWEGILIVRTSDMPAAQQKIFEQWMAGQTRPLIEEAAIAEDDFSYVWDYKRFLATQEGKGDEWD